MRIVLITPSDTSAVCMRLEASDVVLSLSRRLASFARRFSRVVTPAGPLLTLFKRRTDARCPTERLTDGVTWSKEPGTWPYSVLVAACL